MLVELAELGQGAPCGHDVCRSAGRPHPDSGVRVRSVERTYSLHRRVRWQAFSLRANVGNVKRHSHGRDSRQDTATRRCAMHAIPNVSRASALRKPQTTARSSAMQVAAGNTSNSLTLRIAMRMELCRRGFQFPVAESRKIKISGYRATLHSAKVNY